MKLFISWAKDEAREIALALHEFIPSATMKHITTWCSADIKCLPQGPGFPEKILTAARDCEACLVIITRENLSAWWTNFEAGLFFGQRKPVYAILCGDLTHSMLGGAGHPLSANGVNYTEITEESLVSFLSSLKSDDKEWMGNDFQTIVGAKFQSLKNKYDNIFNEDYKKLSSLLAPDSDGTM